MASKVFDLPHALTLASAKKEFMDKFLPELTRKSDSHSALDAGCGLGYFSRYLKEMGLEVKAFDGRESNVEEARKRYPGIEFMVANLEDPAIVNSLKSDIVLCAGLLYHLENPFAAVRNLSALTKKICLIETVIAPFSFPGILLYEEEKGEDQGLNYIAQIPSRQWFMKVLPRAGFEFIYKPCIEPAHEDFISSVFRKKKRGFIIASHIEVSHPLIKPVKVAQVSNRYAWHRRWVSAIMGSRRVRKAAKTLVNNFRKKL